MVIIKRLVFKKVHVVLLLAFFIFSSCIPRKTKENIDTTIQGEPESQSLSHNVYQPLKSGITTTNDAKSTDALSLVTWNIQDLGQSKNTEEIAFIVDVLKDFDIVAIQEVVAKHPAGAQKVAQIADELNRKGSKWDYRISNPTKSPSSNISERYAFLWKTSKVDIQGRAYLDNDLASVIYREPYIAKFKLKKSDDIFHVVNFHSRTHDENPELEIIYFKNYQERLNTDRLIIAGDFNLNEHHKVWNHLYQQGFKSAFKNKKTTLKRKCNRGDYLSHAIDNIYYSKKLNRINSGVVDYVRKCENLFAARLISDHLPVFMEFNFQEKNTN